MSSKSFTDPGAVNRPSEGSSSLVASQPTSPDFDHDFDPETHDDHLHSIRTPPPYSEPSSSSLHISPPLRRNGTSSNHFDFYVGLPRIDYSLYVPPTFILSNDQTKVSCYSAELSQQPRLLKQFITLQATVPPKQLICITGRAHGTTHFDLKLNLMSMLMPPEKGEAWNYIKIVDRGELEYRGGAKKVVGQYTGDLDGWVEMFCNDQTSVKQFILERTVINWDKEALDGRIRSLIASTGYKGEVTVTYPVAYSQVIVNAPDKVNRFISNVTSLFTGKSKYATVKAVWPYADKPSGDGRNFVVQSEQEWWNDWKDALRSAVLRKYKGWVSAEDRLEWLMSNGAVKPPAPDWDSPSS